MPEARGPPSTPLSGGFGLQPGPPGRQAPTITTLSRGFGLQPGPTARPTAPLAIPPNTERRVSAGARLIVAIRSPYLIGVQPPQMPPPTLSEAFAERNLKLVYTIMRLTREASLADDAFNASLFRASRRPSFPAPRRPPRCPDRHSRSCALWCRSRLTRRTSASAP